MTANGSNQSPKEIIIDLSESQNADVFEGGGDSLLQQTALNQVKAIILKLPAKIEKLKNAPSTNNWAYKRSHDVITINGERGSGKTTFILNILKLIPTWTKDSPIRCRIKNIGIIDPTLIEDREHIILTVISKIREEVDRHWEDGRAGSDADSIDDRYEGWLTSLTKLAGGLRNLSDKKATDGDSWSDPQFIMAEGLDNATQGGKLERHFHNFVEKSLLFIDAEAFVIALDDVDTQVKAGWPVLEVLRKYLTTPRLVVILSGDIQLYTQLIFSKQCEQIGVNSEKITEKPDEYVVQRNLVNDLTEQYMMKIMRPDYRIEMQTVAQIAKQSKILVKSIKDKEPEELSKLLKAFCENIYGSKFQLYHLAKVLTEVPTRTCIQLLNTATEFRTNQPNPKDANYLDHMKKTYMEAVAGLGHVFQNSLARAGLSSKLVNEVDADHMTLGRLAMALKNKNLLKQGYHLFPIAEKPWQRQLMMVLGAVYTHSLAKQPAMIFGYQVYICLSAYLQGTLSGEDFKKYIEISQLETENEAINTVKRGTKFILEKSLEKAKSKEADNKVNIAAAFCLKEVGKLPTVASWHHYLLNMASVFAEIDGSSHRYISFTAILGAIATLAGSVKRKEDNEGKVDTLSVINIMRQYGSADNRGFWDSRNDTTGVKAIDLSKSQDAFAELFATWCWSFPEESSVFPLLAITESWSRFSSATTHLNTKYKPVGDNIDQEKEFGPGPDTRQTQDTRKSDNIDQEKEFGPGDYIQDCIILYLNHLLEYELIIMRDSGIEIDPDDNQCIEKRFEGTLAKYVAYIEKKSSVNGKRCKIFEHVFSCPIWMHFFDMNSQDTRGLKLVRANYFKFVLQKTQKSAAKQKPTKENLDKLINIYKCEYEDKLSTNLFGILNKAIRIDK